MRKLIYIILLGIAVIWGCAHTSPELNETMDEFEPEVFRVVFTPMISNDKLAMKDVSEVSINEEWVYICTYWSLPIKKHEMTIRVYDGLGRQIHYKKKHFIPNSTSFGNVTGHRINKYIETPGDWRFEVSMDGKLMVERTLRVLSD